MLKEKFKLIKSNLKIWHRQLTKNIESQILNVKERSFALDLKKEDVNQDMDEVEVLHSLSAYLHSLARIQDCAG